MNYFGELTRCEQFGSYIKEHNATVRDTAKKFGISKSTVHKDVTTTLREQNRSLFDEVYVILQKNKMERHLRGGEATRRKYQAERKREEPSKSI
ncbi:MAG: stage III sporulation protein D [Ruminococcaceae bacterium]|nr:stage III sporulation protein D [Oscillospiraceae bacterium]